MLDARIIERVDRLVAVEFAQRGKQIPLEVERITAEGSRRSGGGRSSRTESQLHELYERELEVRGIRVWQNLMRVHRILGLELTETLADDLKAEFRKHVDKAATELSEGLQKELEKRFGVPRSLREAHLSTVQEHEIEIELYVDDLAQQSLRQQQGLAPRQEYTFYGNVGAVQTGPHASANIVQNLEAKDNEALLSALENVQCWLDTAEALDRVQRQELAELIEESVAELRSGKPNNTKLRSLLTTVGNTILGVASLAQAYHTLKAALLPLGIILP